MMKNRKIPMSASVHELLLALLSLGVFSCGEESPDAESEEETLAEYVARCESFTGDTLADCPEDCALVESVRILYDSSTCEVESDEQGLPIRQDICVAATPLEVGYGHAGVYRRVDAGETAADPVTPSEPEEVLSLKIPKEIFGWERCVEATSDYCACALQFEYMEDG
jgi:hypothetical protein